MNKNRFGFHFNDRLLEADFRSRVRQAVPVRPDGEGAENDRFVQVPEPEELRVGIRHLLPHERADRSLRRQSDY